VDTVGTVIERLLDEWESLQDKSQSNTSSSDAADTENIIFADPQRAAQHFETSRKVKIPLGRLRASYRPRGKGRKELQALVTPRGIEVDGQVFDDPSPAGAQAKKAAGAGTSASITNGWSFWEYFDESSETWVSLSTLRVR
jgi:hypothetical protein